MTDAILKAIVFMAGIGLVLAVSAIGLAWSGFWVAYGIQLAGGINGI